MNGSEIPLSNELDKDREGEQPRPPKFREDGTEEVLEDSERQKVETCGLNEEELIRKPTEVEE